MMSEFDVTALFLLNNSFHSGASCFAGERTVLMIRRRITGCIVLCLLSGDPNFLAADEISFNAQIRPLLADRCFSCHGPDAEHREAELRLDLEPAAKKSGTIVPGHPEQSELIARINSADPELVMPPPDSGRSMTAEERRLLEQWIALGAPWEEHWAYRKPQRPQVPASGNPIDALVQQRLQQAGLQSVEQAEPRTLVRRLYSDLLGLSPGLQQVQDFSASPDDVHWSQLVDSLLQNPHYGERMAIPWLDVVRFADTVGYHSDVPRNVWPYRDWVINSFNSNKPFDRFTIEQIAGDLVNDADQESLLGSAFNRLLLTTEEGGAQPRDYEARMLADRVRAVGTVWLGQTIGCAQCHDHKFDPITMRDFYSLGAFFSDLAEPAIGRREAGMPVVLGDQRQRIEELERIVQTASAAANEAYRQADQQQPAWEQRTRSAAADLRIAGMSADDLKLADKVLQILHRDAAQRTESERKQLSDWHRQRVFPEGIAATAALQSATGALMEYRGQLPTCLVSHGLEQRRAVRILPRGDWMDESGPQVQPAFPSWLPAPDGTGGRELTRLDLARWLVSDQNPLTARTIMNRLWMQFFGTPLSSVPEDLGAQGEAPKNPQLLDFLACEFMESGWDYRHMVRLIVSSRTYRLSSEMTSRLQQLDPQNRHYARQSAIRLDAELIRDTSLAAAGLLSEQIGGRSILPYQPDGYWENLNFPRRTYQPENGAQQYRRGLYVWWQRTFLHPGLLAFDAPSREECCAQRNRSNIPQQALVLLNDPIFVEAARGLAARLLNEDLASDEGRIGRAFEIVLQRLPTEQELAVMKPLLHRHRLAYRGNPAGAELLLQVGQSSLPAETDRAELAAWTHIARVLLNLHETITRS